MSPRSLRLAPHPCPSKKTGRTLFGSRWTTALRKGANLWCPWWWKGPSLSCGTEARAATTILCWYAFSLRRHYVTNYVGLLAAKVGDPLSWPGVGRSCTLNDLPACASPQTILYLVHFISPLQSRSIACGTGGLLNELDDVSDIVCVCGFVDAFCRSNG